MEIEAILAIIAILVPVIIYYAGVKRRDRREHERRQHEQQMEQGRRDKELLSKAADEYVCMARRRYDVGPHALARIGLERLGSDRLIREAIHEMQLLSGTDPWLGKARYVDDVDLVQFFRYVHEHNVDFFDKTVTVEEIARQVKEGG